MSTERREEDTVAHDIEDGVAWVRFNRPEKRNCMSPKLNRQMMRVLEQLEFDDSVGVMVLTGENVYPAEIEAVVYQGAAVAEGAVVGVPDERWGEVGFLFIVGKPNTEVDLQSVLNLLEQKLARYKIPKHAALIGRLPRNAAGKVLKNDLRDDAIRRIDKDKT